MVASRSHEGEAFTKPSVPVIYLLLTLQQGVERGLRRDALLKGTGITPEQLDDPSGYVPLLEYGRIVCRALAWSKDGGLGYDFGLRANLSAQGMPGFGMMNSRTLREASTFGLNYSRSSGPPASPSTASSTAKTPWPTCARPCRSAPCASTRSTWSSSR